MRHSLCLALLAAACGGGGSGAPDAAVAPDLIPMLTCATDNMPVALGPRYGIQASLHVHVRVPAECTSDCVFDRDARSSILMLADVQQRGSSVQVQASPCAIDVPEVALKGQPMPTRITVPGALLRSVPTVQSGSTLRGDQTCASFTSMPLTIVLGARLADPERDGLPVFMSSRTPPIKLCDGSVATRCDAGADTACICDQEGDGSAAATVEASGVPGFPDIDKLYLALRTSFTLDGAVFPPAAMQPTPGQRLYGYVTGLRLDQSPAGCHRMGGDCADNVTNAVAIFNPQVTQSSNTLSTFLAVPVPGALTCDELVMQAATLFQSPP